jgi:hypothetical protein
MREVVLNLCLLLLSVSALPQTRLQSDSVFQKTQKPLKFIVFGDWGRNGEDRQKEVALEMGKTAKKFKPEFIVSTGDNFYPNGVPCNLTGMWFLVTMTTAVNHRPK